MKPKDRQKTSPMWLLRGCAALLAVFTSLTATHAATSDDVQLQKLQEENTALKKANEELKGLNTKLGAEPVPPPQPCANLDEPELRLVPEGFQCMTSKGVVFRLVKRTMARKGKEVWQDTKSDLLISDVLDGLHTHYQAEKLCAHDSSLEARGYLSNVSWRLPAGNPKNKDDDYVTLESNGFREVVPRMRDRWFWSSSIINFAVDYAYYFPGNGGVIKGDSRNNPGDAVRCVGQLYERGQ